MGDWLKRVEDAIEAMGPGAPPFVRSVVPAASGWRLVLMGVRVFLGVVGTYAVACDACPDLVTTGHAGSAAAIADLHDAGECSGLATITVA